jgi:hypothetical protein
VQQRLGASEWHRRFFGSSPRPLTIPTVMDLKTLADVRALIGHLPKAFQQERLHDA